MPQYPDTLGALNPSAPLSDKLKSLHETLHSRFPFIDRISVVLYDPKTDDLKTFIHSSGGSSPLTLYQTKLSDTKSLRQILKTGKPRVVNDLSIFTNSKQEHTKRIVAQGYGASYTLPMYLKGEFFGFVFFNSYRKNVFNAPFPHHGYAQGLP